ncbi:Gfo/Idh/MocA family oxidoreductase [Halorubrum sp. LN27]|uniref:Gfo/Idh/MocA family protein n=1 Tax=Halorubrum sp. LN27 TaxID=2801032 RepID=UPI0019091683|nr:Gfo/Idh/MocA family oxidoreductase [Halorubrum sp. LN27]
MKYGVIGTGYWGSNHARVAAELADKGVIDGVVLCDVDEDRVKELASSYDVEFTTDYSELASMGVGAGTIATPSPTHHQISTELLEDGIDCLVEKPLALNSEDAWDMVETAEEHGRTLGVGHIFRYHPALSELKNRIDRGELGQIKYLNTNRFSFRVPRETAGALYSLAVHDIDISNYLLERKPESLYCNLDSVIRENVDETATITLEYGDSTSIINESWQVPVHGKRRDLTVVGSEKAAYVDYLEDTVVELHDSRVREYNGDFQAQNEGKQVYKTENKEPLKVEVSEFIDACQSGSKLRAPGQVGAETVELLELCEKSSSENQVVTMD